MPGPPNNLNRMTHGRRSPQVNRYGLALPGFGKRYSYVALAGQQLCRRLEAQYRKVHGGLPLRAMAAMDAAVRMESLARVACRRIAESL